MQTEELDKNAGLRLAAAMARLDRFTVRQLADAAQVKYETARSFMTRSRNQGIINDVLDAEPEGVRVGRPEKIYQLSPTRRSTVEDKLRAIRSKLDDVSQAYTLAAGEAAGVQRIASLSMYDWAVSALEKHGLGDRATRLDQIAVFRAAAERDVVAFSTRTQDKHQISSLAEKLGATKARHDIQLADIEARRKTDAGVVEYLVESINSLIDNYSGEWLCEPVGLSAGTGHGVFLYLDACASGPDNPIRRGFAAFGHDAGVPVATLPVARFKPHDWVKVYATLNAAAPAEAGNPVTNIYLGLDDGSARPIDLIDGVSMLHVTPLVPSAARIGQAPRVWCLDVSSRTDLRSACGIAEVNYVGQAMPKLRQTLEESL